jgi:ATP-dependent helicase/nuclease subunit B
MYMHCIEEQRVHPAWQYIFVVPEQASLSTQQQLIRIHPAHSLFGMDVMSFKRLAYRIFEEQNVHLPVVLDEVGKSMLLKKVLLEVQDQLTVYKGSSSKPGFIQKLRSMLSEMTQYQVDEGVLAQAVPQLAGTPQLQGKLHDLMIIRRAFDKALAEHYITAEELMPELTRLVHTSAFLKNSVLVLDGFSDFTPVQCTLMGELLNQCREVYVVLDMTRRELLAPRSDNTLFHLSRTMMDQLSTLAEKAGVPVADPLWLSQEQDYFESEELSFLERHFEQAYGTYVKTPDDLLLLEAENPSYEVEQVCGEIMALVRGGMHYRDLAIVTTDLHTYGDLLERKLLQAGVPFFSDNRHNLSGNMGVLTVLYALEAVEQNFSYEAVFGYLKSGWCREQALVDLMENYCIAAGVRGKKNFEKNWEWKPSAFSEEELALVNEGKNRLLAPLWRLNSAVKGRLTVQERIRALRDFLEDIAFETQMSDAAGELEKRGELELSMEYGQVSEQISGLFDQVCEMLGTERISLKELTEILKTGFGEISVGVVPPTLDGLVIADLRRSRLPEVRAVFVLGMNEGHFPSRAVGGGILNDLDREQLKGCQVRLAPTAKKEGLSDKFHIYRTLTKPGRKLILSFSRQGMDGKALRPSYVLGQIRRLFPALTPVSKGGSIYQVRQGLEALAAGESGQERALRAFYERRPEYAPVVKLIDQARGIRHEAQHIRPETAGILFGQPPITSVTHLEQFASCQMAHFLRYGLQLRERQEHTLQNLDMGNLYHDALDHIFRQMKKEGLSAQDLSDKVRSRLVEEGLNHALERFSSDLFDTSFKNDHTRSRMRDVLSLNLEAVTQQMTAGDFETLKTEMAFGMKGSEEFPAMTISDSPLALMGKIDRLDGAFGPDGSRYLRVVDYKTGGTRFDFTKLMNGLQLQLMLYLSAAVGREDGKAAGAFYYHIDEPVVELSPQELQSLSEEEAGALVRERQLQKLRLKGLLSEEREVLELFEHDLPQYQTSKVLEGLKLKKDGGYASGSPVLSGAFLDRCMEEAEDRAGGLGRTMLAGEIDTNPYLYGRERACTYCPYSGICGFCTAFPGYQYRRISKQNMTEVFQTPTAHEEG